MCSDMGRHFHTDSRLTSVYSPCTCSIFCLIGDYHFSSGRHFTAFKSSTNLGIFTRESINLSCIGIFTELKASQMGLLKYSSKWACVFVC